MKKTLLIFLAVIFLVSFSGLALAAQRIVQLTIPGCSSWNSNSRIGSILKKIDGVTKYENKGHDLLIVNFDDEKTTLNMIINELKKGKFIINGEPIYLK
jgi:hypothetical protein